MFKEDLLVPECHYNNLLCRFNRFDSRETKSATKQAINDLPETVTSWHLRGFENTVEE